MTTGVMDLARQMKSGSISSAAIIDEALARAQGPAGEGPRVFTELLVETARVEATASDRLRARGIVPSLLAGIPISVKDFIDTSGHVTTAGSAILKGAPPAREDAELVKRLRAAGSIIVGRTNMAEFASSALGLNPYYGTPRNRWDRATGRIPGGSSSGAGISVTDGMCTVAIGSDTGGSIRIPAALNGIVGFKPTQRRVPGAGCHMLSDSLDSFGPLADSVMCCALVDAALSGAGIAPPEAVPLERLTFLVPCGSFFLDDLDATVGPCYERALKCLAANGARIVELHISEMAELRCVTEASGVPGVVGKWPLALLAAPEIYANHRDILARYAAKMDLRTAATLQYGENILAADYIGMLKARANFTAAIARALAGFDAFLIPTVSCIAPPIHALEDGGMDAYNAANMAISRNAAAINILDGCALTIPCHEHGTAPVGLSVTGICGQDHHILAAGLSVEAALRSR